MKNKHLLTIAIAIVLMVSFTATSWGQCIIPITDDQPYIEGFEGDGFECWTVEVNGGEWAPVAGSQSTAVYFTYHNVGDEARLISPIFDMSAVASVTFSFSFSMIGLYQNDELVVSYRTSETDDWHDLGSYSYSDYSIIYEESFELDNLTSTYQISFLGRGLGGLYIFIDNIEIIGVGGCARPVNLQVTEKTAFSALLGWSTTGNEASWVVETNGNLKTVETQPFLLEDLEPQTDYTFRVKANCSNGMESEWSVPMTFKTLCDVITVTDDEPYFDDFEASEDFVCWQNEIISGEDGWVVDPGYLILNNTAFFIWLGGEALLISAPLDITAVTNPTLTFKHKQPHGYNSVDELSVWYRTSETSDWHLLGNYTYVTDDWENITLALPDPSASYHICFKAKANNADGVYVDDVRIGSGTGGVGIMETPTLMASVSPNPATEKAFIDTNVTEGEVEVFDLFGKKVAAAPLVEGRVEINLCGLAQGVYTVQITGPTGMAIVKLVKE